MRIYRHRGNFHACLWESWWSSCCLRDELLTPLSFAVWIQLQMERFRKNICVFGSSARKLQHLKKYKSWNSLVYKMEYTSKGLCIIMVFSLFIEPFVDAKLKKDLKGKSKINRQRSFEDEGCRRWQEPSRSRRSWTGRFLQAVPLWMLRNARSPRPCWYPGHSRRTRSTGTCRTTRFTWSQWK